MLQITWVFFTGNAIWKLPWLEIVGGRRDRFCIKISCWERKRKKESVQYLCLQREAKLAVCFLWVRLGYPGLC